MLIVGHGSLDRWQVVLEDQELVVHYMGDAGLHADWL